MRRYCVTIKKYIWAEDDASAVKAAVHITEGLRAKGDGMAEVVSIVEHEWGKAVSRDVEIKGEAPA